jgi:hypothetical protein
MYGCQCDLENSNKKYSSCKRMLHRPFMQYKKIFVLHFYCSCTCKQYILSSWFKNESIRGYCLISEKWFSHGTIQISVLSIFVEAEYLMRHSQYYLCVKSDFWSQTIISNLLSNN